MKKKLISLIKIGLVTTLLFLYTSAPILTIASQTEVSTNSISANVTISENNIPNDAPDSIPNNVPDNTPADSSEALPETMEISEPDVPKDVISVLLPTEFDVSMYYDPKNGIGCIQSEDILMINTSDFPVNVNIKSVSYQVHREKGDTKEHSLSMLLKQYQQDDVTYNLTETEANTSVTVPLAPINPETNFSELMKKAKTGTTDTIHSSDYAVIHFDGLLQEGNWKDGDIKVLIVYELEHAK